MGKLVTIAIAILSLIAIAATAASARQTDNEFKSAANATVNRFVDSWNREDGVEYGENYWPDAELVDPSGNIFQGRAAIAQMHVKLWGGIFKGSHQKAAVRRIQVLCPDLIVVDFDAHLSGMRGLPPGAPGGRNRVLIAHLKHILQKRHGVWKVLDAQNTLAASSSR